MIVASHAQYLVELRLVRAQFALASCVQILQYDVMSRVAYCEGLGCMQSCIVEHVVFLESITRSVSIIQTGHHHRHRLAPLSGAISSSGTLCRTNNRRVYANVILMQSSFWHRETPISGAFV